MTGIFNGIQAIIDTITAPIRFLAGIISWTNKMLEIIIETVAEVVSVIATLPNWLIAYASVGLAIIVIAHLIGRGTGK